MSKNAIKILSEGNMMLRKAIETKSEKRKFQLISMFCKQMVDYCQLMAAFEENKEISIQYQQEAFTYRKFKMLFESNAAKAGVKHGQSRGK